MFPAELYQCIIGNLDHSQDRQTLLSAAQCCSILREESQRILFRSTTGALWYGEDQVTRHKMFLEAVLHAPGRLALYVRELVQLAIGWEPGFLYETSKYPPDSDFEARIRVYELTVEALPFMVNLKTLSFSPFRASPSAHILRHCSFQLHVLEWWQPGCENELLSSFFPRQNKLRYIKIYWRSDRKVPRNILPRLVFAQGSLLTLAAFSESADPGKILAFEYRNTSLDQQLGVQRTMEILSGLKCICVTVEYHLSVITRRNRLPDSVILLQITLAVFTTLDFLQYASLNLRGLVLRRSGSLPTLSQAEKNKLALTAFMLCPSLQYVELYPLDSTHVERILRPGHPTGDLIVNTFTVDSWRIDWWKRHILDGR